MTKKDTTETTAATVPAQASAPAAGGDTVIVGNDVRRDTAGAVVIADNGARVEVTINQGGGGASTGSGQRTQPAGVRPAAQGDGSRHGGTRRQDGATTIINNTTNTTNYNFGDGLIETPIGHGATIYVDGTTGNDYRGDGSDTLTYPQGDIRNPLDIGLLPGAEITEPFVTEAGKVSRIFTATGATGEARVIFVQRTADPSQPVITQLDPEPPAGSFDVFFEQRQPNGEWRQMLHTNTSRAGFEALVSGTSNGVSATHRIIADPTDAIWGPWVGVDYNADNWVTEADRWATTDLATIDHTTRDKIQDFFLTNSDLADIVTQAGYPVANIGGQPTDLGHVRAVPARMEVIDNPDPNASLLFAGRVNSSDIIRQK